MKNETKIERGQIFVCTWGDKKPVVDFYEVVSLTLKGVFLCKIAIQQKSFGRILVKQTLPTKGEYIGDPFFKVLREDNSVKLTDGQYASPWDGTTYFI